MKIRIYVLKFVCVCVFSQLIMNDILNVQNLVAIILRPVLTLMKIKGEGAPAFIQCHVLESVVLNVSGPAI